MIGFAPDAGHRASYDLEGGSGTDSSASTNTIGSVSVSPSAVQPPVTSSTSVLPGRRLATSAAVSEPENRYYDPWRAFTASGTYADTWFTSWSEERRKDVIVLRQVSRGVLHVVSGGHS